MILICLDMQLYAFLSIKSELIKGENSLQGTCYGVTFLRRCAMANCVTRTRHSCLGNRIEIRESKLSQVLTKRLWKQ
jgi:hypothetical protein